MWRLVVKCSPPGFGPLRRISKQDKGKEAVVPEDPVIEAIHRAMAGGGPMIRDGGQGGPMIRNGGQHAAPDDDDGES